MQCHPSNKFFIKVLSGCIFLLCATPHNWNIWRRRALSAQDLRHCFSSKIKTFAREIRCTLIHFKRCTNNGDYAAPLVKGTWRRNIDFVCVQPHAFIQGIKADRLIIKTIFRHSQMSVHTILTKSKTQISRLECQAQFVLNADLKAHKMPNKQTVCSAWRSCLLRLFKP